MIVAKELIGVLMAKVSLDRLVFARMSDGQWWTFWDLRKQFASIGHYYGEPSISAAIRNLRKDYNRIEFDLPKTGEVVEKRKIYGGKGYEYKLIRSKNGI